MTTIGMVNETYTAGFEKASVDLSSTFSPTFSSAITNKISTPSVTSSGLKGSIETQEMIQGKLSQMMKDVTPFLGQNVDIRG